MLRFLLLALPSLVLTMAMFYFGWDYLGLGASVDLPPIVLFSSWLLESLGLIVAFLLIRGRGRGRWLAAIGGAWLAWVFRGPLLVLTLVGAARLPREPWWNAALGWFGLYTVCALLLVVVAERSGLDR
ncbi:MAG: hypothetical protein KDD11_21655 [Acidobacteria bacterium]|nr:hypothetical protein [Acidobacteriota bacterium]